MILIGICLGRGAGVSVANGNEVHVLSRASFLKTLHQWHWISSAICLVAMILFSLTGITLNNAALIEARPVVVTLKDQLPEVMQQDLARLAVSRDGREAFLPPELVRWMGDKHGVQVQGVLAEWSLEEIYVSLPRPGGDAWARLSLTDGEFEYERTDRGWISWLNDLHKGRHTGVVWSWFIDIFAAACLVFSLSGLLILKYHAGNRPLTWPMVGLGVLLPALIVLLFMH